MNLQKGDYPIINESVVNLHGVIRFFSPLNPVKLRVVQSDAIPRDGFAYYHRMVSLLPFALLLQPVALSSNLNCWCLDYYLLFILPFKDRGRWVIRSMIDNHMYENPIERYTRLSCFNFVCIFKGATFTASETLWTLLCLIDTSTCHSVVVLALTISPARVNSAPLLVNWILLE